MIRVFLVTFPGRPMVLFTPDGYGQPLFIHPPGSRFITPTFGRITP